MESSLPPDLPLGILADVHSNLEALRAVLADADGEGVRRFVCLGDLVGYGADPDKVLDLLMSRGVQAVTGNHDLAAIRDERRMNPLAAEAIEYTRQKLRPGPTSNPALL